MSSTETKTVLTKSEYIRKKGLFYGTIAVCVIYAAVSLILLAVVKYTERGKVLLAESNFPFAITFVLGMIIVISILSIKVGTFKPNVDKRGAIYDNIMCPDYWELRRTPKDILSSFTAEEKIGKEYTCMGTSSSTSKLNLKSSDKYERQLAEMARSTFGNDAIDTTNADMINIECGALYPQHMSKIDMINNPETQNNMRCAYAQKCGITWSSICPDMD